MCLWVAFASGGRSTICAKNEGRIFDCDVSDHCHDVEDSHDLSISVSRNLSIEVSNIISLVLNKSRHSLDSIDRKESLLSNLSIAIDTYTSIIGMTCWKQRRMELCGETVFVSEPKNSLGRQWPTKQTLVANCPNKQTRKPTIGPLTWLPLPCSLLFHSIRLWSIEVLLPFVPEIL